VLASLGVTSSVTEAVITVAGFVVTLSLNALVIMIVISRLGGVQPQRWRWRSSFMGGSAMAVVQLGTTFFVALTLSNPRYLSFGAPIAMLLLFFAMAAVVLIAAAFVATANEPDPITEARRQQVPSAPRRTRTLGSW
jgi:membrane protein